MSYSYRKIWLVALPVLVSVLMEHMIGLTDTAFLGRIGEVELGASALGSVYFHAGIRFQHWRANPDRAAER